MAMTTCRECSKEVSDTAQQCPSCGAKDPAKGKVNAFAGLLVIGGVIYLIFVLYAMRAPESAQSPPPVTVPEPPPVVDPAPLIPHWTYNTSEDRMSGGTTRTATVLSFNSFEFESPYSGEQRALLTLRRHPRYGTDAYFSIERGQLLCRPYNDCKVTVRFGEGKPQTFTAEEPEDNSSTILFIANYERFLRGVRGTDVVRISVPVYKQGDAVLEFDVSGLDW